MSVAVITGGAGEIGRALVASYAADGFEVHVLDLSAAAADVAAAAGGVAHVYDAGGPEAVAALEALPRIDVLVNGVGLWPLTPLDKLTPPRWRRLVDINLNSAYVTTWACRAGLRAASGAAVSIASAIALKGHPQMAYYTAAKAGVIGMTKALAQALGPDGVRVNAVAPGLIDTERNMAVWSPESQAAFRSTRALPVDLGVDDVVSAVRFFTSPAARVITGQTLVVDGGTVLH